MRVDIYHSVNAKVKVVVLCCAVLCCVVVPVCVGRCGWAQELFRPSICKL